MNPQAFAGGRSTHGPPDDRLTNVALSRRPNAGPGYTSRHR